MPNETLPVPAMGQDINPIETPFLPELTGNKVDTNGTPAIEAGVLPVVPVETNYAGGPFSGILTGQQASMPVDTYRKYINNVRLEDDVARIAASNQTLGSQIANFGAQALGEIAGIAVSGLGSFLKFGANNNPLTGIYDLVTGSMVEDDEDFGNVLIEAGEGIRQYTKDAFPILEQNPGKTWALDDSGWWLGKGVSVASAAGMFIPGMALTKGVTWIARAAELGKLGKLGSIAAGVLPQTRKGREVAKVLTTAFGMRHAENVSESFQVVNDVRKQAIEQLSQEGELEKALVSDMGQRYLAEGGKPTVDAFANYVAGTAGHRAYAINSANLVFDIFQASALMKTNYFTRTGRSASAEVIAANTGRTMSTIEKVGRRIKGLGVGIAEAGSEGVEEMVNYFGSKRATEEADAQMNKTAADPVFASLSKALQGDEIWENGFFGSIGGGVFAGGARLKTVLGSKEGKADTARRLAEIRSRQNSLLAFNTKVKNIAKEVDAGNISKEDAMLDYDDAHNELATNLAYNAAQNGNVDLLIDMIDNTDMRDKMFADMTSDEIKANGLLESINVIDNLKKVVYDVERDYNYAVNKFSTSKLANPLTKKVLIDEYVGHKSKIRAADKQLNTVESLMLREFDNSAKYDELLKSGINVEAQLHVAALKSLKASMASDVKAVERIDAELKNAMELIPEGETDVMSKLRNSRIGELSVAKAGLAVSRLSLKGLIDTMLDDKAQRNLDSNVSAFIEKEKKTKVDSEYQAFVDDTKVVMDKLPDTATKIVYLNTMVAKTKDTKRKAHLSSLLANLEAIHKQETASAPVINKGNNKASNAPNEPTKEDSNDIDFEAMLKEHNDTAVMDEITDTMEHIANNPNTPVKNRKKLQALQTKIANLGYASPLTDSFIADQIEKMNASIGTEINTENGISRGEVYTDKDGNTLKVTKMTKSAIQTVVFFTENGGSIYKMDLQDFIDNLDTKVTDKTGDNFNALSDKLNKNEIVTFEELLQAVYPDIHTGLLFAASGYTVIKSSGDAVTLDRNKKLLHIGPGFSELVKNGFAKEVIEHELAHIILGEERALDAIGLAEFQDAAKKLITPKEMIGTRSQGIREAVASAITPGEELIIYYLTNDDFYALVNNEKNHDTALKINAYINGIPRLEILLQQRQANMSLPIVQYNATPGAVELANRMGINMNAIEAKREDGKITIHDVNRYIKERGLVSRAELEATTDAQSQIEDIGGVNLFTPFINNGIVNGQVSAKAYNDYVTSRWEDAITVTQQQLEAAVRVLVNPYFNVNGKNVNNQQELILRKTGKGIGFYSGDVLLGFLNSPANTEALINFVDELLAINDVNELTKLDDGNLRWGEMSMFKWRMRELKGENTDKPLTGERNRLAKVHAMELMLKSQVEQVGGGVVKVRIVRKTSGNLGHTINNRMSTVNEIFPDVDDVFIKRKDETGPVLTGLKSGRVFNRNVNARDYFNHDQDYDHGVGYALVKGANSIPGRLETYIPVRLFGGNANEDIAESSADVVGKIVLKARELKTAGKPVYNNPEIIKLRRQLEYFFPIDFKGQLEENYIMITDDVIKIDYVQDGERRHMHIYFKIKGSGEITMYDAKYKFTKEKYQAANTHKIVGPKGTPIGSISIKEINKSSSSAEKKYAEESKKLFRTNLVRAFSNKRTHLNLATTKTADGKTEYMMDYAGEFMDTGMSYPEYMLKNGALLTDVLPLTDSNGNIMKDEFGDTLPPITGKGDNNKNSNFILAIEPIGVTVPAISQTLEGKTVGGLTPSTDEAVNVVKDKPKETTDFVIADQYRSILGRLLNGESVNVSEFDNVAKAVIAMKKAIGAGYSILQNGDTVTIKSNSSGLGSSSNDVNKRFRVVRPGDELLDKINVENAAAWWASTFGNNVPLDMNAVGVINEGGELAWGYFEDAMVRMSQSAPVGTEFHEAYHVVHWLYLTDEEQALMLQESADRHGPADDVTLEEHIADDLRLYLMNNGRNGSIPSESFTARIFKKLRNLIMKLFGRYNDTTTLTDKVFKNIKDGGFNYKPSPENVKRANGIKRFKVVDGLTATQEAEVIAVISEKIISHLSRQFNAIDNAFDVNEISDDITMRDHVRLSLADEISNIDDEVQQENIFNVTVDVMFNKLWPKALANLERTFGVKIEEDSMAIADKELERNWDDSIMSVSQRNNVNASIKKLIMTSKTGIPGRFLGLSTYLDFNKIYPYMQRILSGAENATEMLNRLEVISHFDGGIANVFEAVRNDAEILPAFYTVFKNQVPDINYVNISDGVAKVDKSNKNMSHYVVSNSWASNFQSKLEVGKITDGVIKSVNDARADVRRLIAANNILKAVETATTALSLVGIDVNTEKLFYAINMRHIQEKHGKGAGELLLHYVDPILFRTISTEVKAYNVDKANYRFTNFANLNRLAHLATLFSYDLLENSGLNVNGDMMYSAMSPNHLSNFMDKINAVKSSNLYQVDNYQAKANLLELLKSFARDYTMDYSNWLWESSDGSGNGMLRLVNGEINPDGLTVNHLNIPFISKFGYSLMDGLKNVNTKSSNQYKNMPNRDWDLTQLLMYFGGVTGSVVEGDEGELGLGTIKIANPIPADSGNIYFVEVPRLTGVARGGGVIRNSPIYNALINLVYQDIYAAIGARDLMFDYNDKDGTITVKKDLDLNVLIEGYHFNGYESDGRPMLLKDGQPTGNVFQHHAIKQAEGIGFDGRIPNHDKGETRIAENNAKVIEAVESYIASRTQVAYNRIKGFEGLLLGNKKFQGSFGNNLVRFAIEFDLNFKIHTQEQQNFFIGTTGQFKNVLDVNKRAKGLSSPGRSVLDASIESFRAATIADVVLPSEYFSVLAKAVADSIRQENKNLSKVNFNVANLLAKKPANKLEDMVYNVIGGYLNINTGDAQGYISIKRFRYLYANKMTPGLDNILTKAELGIPLTFEEYQRLLQPIKGFYNGREYDEMSKTLVTNQIKYSTLPLVPLLVNGTQLEHIKDWMDTNNLDEVFFKSAEKVGGRAPLVVTDSNGSIDLKKLNSYNEKTYPFRLYKNRNWRLQVEAPDHFVDEVNKLGTQITKLIVANLHPNAVYKYNGKSVGALELLTDFNAIISENIQKDADELLERMGVTVDDSGAYTVTDIAKVHAVLNSEVKRRMIPDNYADSIELITDADGTVRFTMPLFMSLMANKWESILSSMFTNNVVNQKHAGGSLVLASSAFITKPKIVSENDIEIFGNEGIEWIKEKADSKDYRLKMPLPNELGSSQAEILVPRFSKNLYTINEFGKYVPIHIDDIDPEVLNQLWYRIPFEKKGSVVFAKVVGFLPESVGNIIVTPHELITMSGEDHDFDKRYGMYLNTYKDIDGVVRRYKYFYERNDEAFDQWRAGYHARKYAKELRQNPTEAIKSMETQLKRFKTIKDTAKATAQVLYSTQISTVAEAIEIAKPIFDIEADEQVTFKEIIEIARDRIDFAYQMLNEHNASKTNWLEGEAWNTFLDVQRAWLEEIEQYKNAISQLYYATNQFQEEWQALKIGAKSSKADGNEYKKAKARRQEIFDKYVAGYNDALIAELRAEFESIPISSLNNRESRENLLLDMIASVLQNKAHYAEMLQPSGFATAKEVIDEISSLKVGAVNNEVNINEMSFSDYEVQSILRKRNMDGRTLKGLAANAHAFLSVLQVSKAELERRYGHIVLYEGNAIDVKALKAKYGDDNVYEQRAENYLVASAIKFDKLEEVTNPVEWRILNFFADGGKINPKSFKRFGDAALIKDGDVLNYINTKGRDIDDLAQELSTEGMEVTPQDVVDFISTNRSINNYVLELKQRYSDTTNGKKVVAKNTEIPSKVYVRHTRLGWNIDNSFTDLTGKFMTDNTAEVLSLSLDIVKEGMIPNVNTYTFNTFITMLMTGVDLRYASLFINQPFIEKAAKLFDDNQGIMENYSGTEATKVTDDLYRHLLRVMATTGQLTDKEVSELEYNIVNSFKRNIIDEKLKVITVDNSHGMDKFNVVDGTILSDKELADAITYFSSGQFKKDIASSKRSELNRAARMLRQQIYVAKKFKAYKDAGQAYSDVLDAMSTDRKAVGPAVSNVIKLHDAIYHAAHYDTPGTNYKVQGGFWSPIADDAVKSNEARTTTAFMPEDADDTGFIASGARIFTKITSPTGVDKVPLVVGVYPEHFGRRHKSVYPMLNTYKTAGFDLAYKVISDLMLKYQPALIEFARDVHVQAGIRFDEDVFNRATSFAITSMVAQSPWINDGNRERILGLNVVEYNEDVNISVEEFNKLSTANKLYIIKKKKADMLENTNHILNYLFPKMNSVEVKRVGFQSIEFLNSITDTVMDNNLSNSFEELWNSSDEYEHSLARDLVKYNFHSTGFTYKLHSFGKILPVSVFTSDETDLVSYMTYLKNNADKELKLQPDLMDRFMRSMYNNSTVIPQLNLANHVNFSQYAIDRKSKILTVSQKIIRGSNDKIRRSQYLHVTEGVPVVDEEGKVHYKQGKQTLYMLAEETELTRKYIPVNKLGTTNIVETTTTSIVPWNTVPFTVAAYQELIKNGGSLNINSANINDVKETDMIPQYEFLWPHVSAYIGAVPQKRLSAKSFATRAAVLFGESANKSEYDANDIVMVATESIISMYKEEDAAVKTLEHVFDNKGNFINQYKKIDDAIAAGATIAIPSKHNRVFTYDTNFHYALSRLQDKLDKMVKDGLIVSDEDGSKGIIYYAKPNYLQTIDEHKCYT